jgi:hypothetical protein
VSSDVVRGDLRSFQPHYGPRIDSTSNRDEYQKYFLGVPIVLKSGSLKLLEPSGPVKACNGNALPLPLLDNNVYVANLYL